MRCNLAGIELIKKFEGLRLRAYRDAVGGWTIGWGHTKGAKPGLVISEHQAEAILDVDLDEAERGVTKYTHGIPLTENQFSALVSFVFNLGEGRLAESTLLKKLEVGDIAGAATEFMRWKYAAGKVLPGLVKRRAAERDLFLKV